MLLGVIYNVVLYSLPFLSKLCSVSYLPRVQELILSAM